jgi:hypothetical protein
MNYQTCQEEIDHTRAYETLKTAQNGEVEAQIPAKTTTRILRNTGPNIAAEHYCFAFGRLQVQFSTRRPAILTQIFRVFPLSLQANAGIVRPRPLPYIYFPIHYSSIIPSFDAM